MKSPQRLPCYISKVRIWRFSQRDLHPHLGLNETSSIIRLPRLGRILQRKVEVAKELEMSIFINVTSQETYLHKHLVQL